MYIYSVWHPLYSQVIAQHFMSDFMETASQQSNKRVFYCFDVSVILQRLINHSEHVCLESINIKNL